MTRFKDCVEYDAYMRPVYKLGRCHYKGGGTTTTVQKRDIPNQSAEEAALQKDLLAYQNSGLSGAKDLQGRALDYINKTYNPDWAQLYNQYNGDMGAALRDFQNTGDANLNAYTKALQDNQDWFTQKSKEYAEGLKSDSAENLRKYDESNRKYTDDYSKSTEESLDTYKNTREKNLIGYQEAQDSTLDSYKSAQDRNLQESAANSKAIISDYDARVAKDNAAYDARAKADKNEYDANTTSNKVHYMQDNDAAQKNYDAIENPAFKNYQDGMSEVNAGMKDVSNGILSGDYAKNRRAALQDDLDATTGSLLANMARRGIINSSVTNSGLDSINQSASDTLAKNYSSDLAQQAGLLGNRGSLLQNTYTTAHGKATDERNNAQTIAQNKYNMAQDAYNKMFTQSQGVTDNLYKNSTAATNNVFNQQNTNEQNRYKNTSDVNTGWYNGKVSAIDKGYNASVDTNDKIYAAEGAQDKSVLDYNLNNNNNWYKGAQTNTNNYYDTLSKNMNTQYAGKTADANSIYQAGSTYAGNLLQARQSTANNVFQGAAQAQVNSYYAPSKMLDYAQNLYLPAQNQYNTMYAGRMGSAGTTSTTSSPGDDSSVWGAAGQLGAAAIKACFTGDTLVAVPEGYKNIKDVVVGDEVISVDKNGKEVMSRVTAVTTPTLKPIVHCTFDNGTVWHTTASQRYFDGKHFSYIDYPGQAVVYHGTPSRIIALVADEQQELVYDITVEGVNVFYANDIAAEGFGD